MKFVASVTEPHQYPAPKPEIVLAGRSNAGKSSLINALAKEKVAKVSQMPGKTVTLNFYDVGAHYRWVDMPGYGFSKRSGHDQMAWQAVVETYLASGRPTGVLIVIDCHRKPEDEERMLTRFLKQADIPYRYVLTKVDRLKKSEREQLLKGWRQEVFLTSAEKNEGLEELEEFVFKNWVKK